jgi:hypothetical protein
VKYVSQVLVGVAVSWQPGLVRKRGNPEMVCTGQGGRVWGAGPTQPQLGVNVKVSICCTVTRLPGSLVDALVIDVTNGAHSVVGVVVGAARFGMTSIAKKDGRGLVRVMVVDPEGPRKLV